jgi:endonuclease YncB( thermonuclease family)
MRRFRSALTLGVMFFAMGIAAQPAAAATCSDYSNQAEAQRAADTIDADGDGIYCESLPCPCVRPGDSPTPNSPPSTTPPPQPRPTPTPRPTPRPQPQPRRQARVYHDARITSVLGGDTIRVKLANGVFTTVRLLGIDSPETKDPDTPVECGGLQATDFLWRLAFPDPQDTNDDGLMDARGQELGRRATLRTDPTQATRDRFGRLLAYVTTLAGRNLAVEQLSAGWANVFVFDRPFQQTTRFRTVSRRAKARARGAWSMCGGNFHRAR